MIFLINEYPFECGPEDAIPIIKLPSQIPEPSIILSRSTAPTQNPAKPTNFMGPAG